mgnify:CR=1 FL=1
MNHALHMTVSGDGPPLVLIHGWAMHGGVFATLVERLRDRRTLYCIDLPGHGLSRDDATPLQFDAVCDAIQAQVPVAPWLGWSLGSMFALHAAVRDQFRVAEAADHVRVVDVEQFARSDLDAREPDARDKLGKIGEASLDTGDFVFAVSDGMGGAKSVPGQSQVTRSGALRVAPALKRSGHFPPLVCKK